MVANVRGYTPNYKFKLINFDTPRWHTLEYANWQLIDNLMLQTGTPPIRGEWQNSIMYIPGDRVVDPDTGDLYRCATANTSSALGTFTEERLAHPSYWTIQTIGVPVFRNDWQPSVAYSIGDIVVVDDYKHYLCTDAHTASLTFPPDEPLYWSMVYDGTDVVEDSEAARDAAINAKNAAETAAANAANQASEAQEAADEATNAQAAFRWRYDGSTAMADPGPGLMRSNGPVTLTTALSISAQSSDVGSPDVSDWLISWDDSTNAVKGTLFIREISEPQNYAVFDVMGAVVDHGSWLQVPVAWIASGGAITGNTLLSIAFTRAGNVGPTGSGGGDMLKANNLNDVLNKAASRTNIGVGSADIPAFNQTLLAQPATDPTHAVRLSDLSPQLAGKVNTIGDTMTGPLSLPGDPQTGLHATTKSYAETSVRQINTQTGTAYTLALTDRGKFLWLCNVSPITLTIPAYATVALPTGTQIDLSQCNSGQVAITPAGGVTLVSEDGYRKTAKIYACATLLKLDTDTWLLTGSLTL